MEGRPVGDEIVGGQVGSDGEGHDDVGGSVGEEPLSDSSETGPCTILLLCLSFINCSVVLLSLFTAEPTPNASLSGPTSIPESKFPP